MKIIKRRHTAASGVVLVIGLGLFMFGLVDAPAWAEAIILGCLAIKAAHALNE